MELTFGHFVVCLATAIVGWLGGCYWTNWQWENCARKDMDMRVSGKYLYRVEYLGRERTYKI